MSHYYGHSVSKQNNRINTPLNFQITRSNLFSGSATIEEQSVGPYDQSVSYTYLPDLSSHRKTNSYSTLSRISNYKQQRQERISQERKSIDGSISPSNIDRSIKTLCYNSANNSPKRPVTNNFFKSRQVNRKVHAINTLIDEHKIT